MNKFSLSTAGILVAALLTSVSVNAATTDAKTDVTPKNMSCQEFIDLNPQTMAPVAFWVLNEDEDFKGGDYVTFDETVTTAVPLTVEICKKHPQSELTKIKVEIKKELSK
ncbi:acid-activated periplasmic chaperone HdeB [Citrobacter amalonaticus]|uniref:acid-activated periplasmic chaperone HdeB n=1 Tax=Citrobacter amalonaticus TaxID=35703 RepID=UPI003314EF4B|nr:acid-activated periplasmic chaperone HdeB [Citrobacter amalonaticus]HCB1901459.1 acid-activated periplasmic chaperone HdeB [Citrobacter amalonaticus]